MKKVFLGLEIVKKQISDLKGVDIDIEVNIGRKKIKQFNGIIQSVYPSVFTFMDSDGNIKTFSYSDILCGDVKIL